VEGETYRLLQIAPSLVFLVAPMQYQQVDMETVSRSNALKLNL
jgi:hypothetical protein